MVKIVILSADAKNVVGAKDLERQLQQKEHTVLLINLLNLTRFSAALARISASDLASLKTQISTFSPKKIFVCVHGLSGHTKMSFHEVFAAGNALENMFSASEFGIILSKILPLTPIRIELMMCYGARTGEYKTDHIKHIRSVNIFDSYAYRLVMHIATVNRRFDLNAYVTAVGFNNGIIFVEHEIVQRLKQQHATLATQRIAIQQRLQRLRTDDPQAEVLQFDDYQLLLKQKALTESIVNNRTTGLTPYGQVNFNVTGRRCRIQFNHNRTQMVLYDGVLKTRVPPTRNKLLTLAHQHPRLTAFTIMALGVLIAYLVKRLIAMNGMDNTSAFTMKP